VFYASIVVLFHTEAQMALLFFAFLQICVYPRLSAVPYFF